MHKAKKKIPEAIVAGIMEHNHNLISTFREYEIMPINTFITAKAN